MDVLHLYGVTKDVNGTTGLVLKAVVFVAVCQTSHVGQTVRHGLFVCSAHGGVSHLFAVVPSLIIDEVHVSARNVILLESVLMGHAVEGRYATTAVHFKARAKVEVVYSMAS